MCSCQANWRQQQVRIKHGSLRAKFTAMRPEIEQSVQLLRQEQALAVNEAGSGYRSVGLKALLKAVLSVTTLCLSSDLRHDVIPKGSQFTLSHVTGQWFRSAAQITLGDTHIPLGHFRSPLVSAEAGPGSVQQSN